MSHYFLEVRSSLFSTPVQARGPIWLDDRRSVQWKWMEEVLHRTSRAPFASLCFLLTLIGLEAKGLLDFQGPRGITSVVRWNLRVVIFGVDKLPELRHKFLKIWAILATRALELVGACKCPVIAATAKSCGCGDLHEICAISFAKHFALWSAEAPTDPKTPKSLKWSKSDFKVTFNTLGTHDPLKAQKWLTLGVHFQAQKVTFASLLSH